MNWYKIILPIFLFLWGFSLLAQKTNQTPRGKLFIIGGGDRPPALLQSLATEAGLNKGGYIIVLPMSSGQPDTSYYYCRADLETVCRNPIINFNFTAAQVNNKSWLDSLERARLIFITGGDQERFMGVVRNTPLFTSIHKAYQNGATIAGTSAGAAVMSKYMITGNQLTDTLYRSTFPKLVDKNVEIKEGLGLLPNAVVDQHFIVRSRYNRLFSALARFPKLTCIGIDEETAIIVQNKTIRIAGESQVVVISKPQQLKVTATGLVKWKEARFSIYTKGDEFTLEQ